MNREFTNPGEEMTNETLQNQAAQETAAQAMPQAQEQPQTTPQMPQQPEETQPVNGYYHYRNDAQSSGYQPGQAYQNSQRAGYSGYSRPAADSAQGYYTRPQSRSYAQPGQPGAQRPQRDPSNPYGYATQQTPPAKEKKSGGLGLKIAALALACVIAGGVVGGGIATAVTRKSETPVQPTAAVQAPIEESVSEFGGDANAASKTPEAPAADEGETENTEQAFQRTTINIKSNAENNALTPKDVYENYVNAVVAISNEGTTTNYFGQTSKTASSGSGMIISDDGYILTNNHVVAGAETLTVIMTNGEEYPAQIIGADSENDVALIKIDATDLPTVAIGNSDNIAVGQQVCAIGNPLGELTNTLTVGYVSALDRDIFENAAGSSISMFQTDCAINSGNSGGPIFDMSGNVIGITTAKYSSSGMSSNASIEGIGFCVPINDAMDIVNDFLTYGYVRGRATLGITCQTISNTVTQYYNLPLGVYVVSVTPGSGAEAAGLKEGDIICTVNGEKTETVSALKLLLKGYSPGDVVTIEYYRDGKMQTVDLTLGESVAAPASSQDENVQGDTQQGQQSPYGSTQIPFPFFW